LQGVFQPPLGFEEFTLNDLSDGVARFPFREGITQFASQLEQLLIVALPDPTWAMKVVTSHGDSQKIFQQIAGILPKQHTSQFLSLSDTSVVAGELANRLSACLGRFFKHALRILFGRQPHRQQG
jgi:hypothetical protein